MLLLKIALLPLPWLTLASADEIPDLLVANTRGDQNIVGRGFDDSEAFQEFLGGFPNPDHIRIVDDGETLFTTVGDTAEDSAIVKINLRTGERDDRFATSATMFRPYGFDFYKNRIYVASFRSDEIIVFDQTTGDYIGIFAKGDGTEEGLLNGPNQIDIEGDLLYVTLQGSVALGNGDVEFTKQSQTLVYDLKTGLGRVFAPQPTPLPKSLGFVSMLGVWVGERFVWTTDFAGGLRKHDITNGDLVYEVETTFMPGAITGSLSILDGIAYVTVYQEDANVGSVLTFKAMDGTYIPPSVGGVVYDPEFGPVKPDPEIVRPIGILAGGGSKKKGKKRKRKSGKKRHH